MKFFNLRAAFLAVLGGSLCIAVVAQNGSTGDKGFDISRMDNKTMACDNFYEYANGTWLKNTVVPAAFPTWGSFDILSENNRKTLHDILEDASKNRTVAAGTNEQKIGDFYATCMDTASREAAGAKPLTPYLADINKISDVKNLQAEIGSLHKAGLPALFGFGSGADFKNSSMTIALAAQGGLSLPSKDYYLKTDADSVKLRQQFVGHVANMFTLLGDSPEQAKKNADTVMRIETRLAQNSRGPVELRDPTTQYHMMNSADLAKLTPTFSWTSYFATLGVPTNLTVNVAHPEFFQNMDKMLTEVPIEDWKTYLRWSLANATASTLSSKFETEHFNFYGGVLEGRREQQPLWRRCVSATDSNLGEALGQVYVSKAFTPAAKQRMQEMVTNLIAAFNERLTKLDWMGDTTRKAAMAKLAAFGEKIGYPEKWIDYSRYKVARDSYMANVIRGSEFGEARDLNKIGKPVDKTEWDMTPPTVNAYNNWVRNEIVFPAGILQPPFFNPNADDAVNYGSIGAVIGHEITHGFDDQGAKFDLHGNLSDPPWWSDADLKRFEQKSDCIVKQFDAFEVSPGLHMIGKLVAGESIADLGGLTVAYHAMEKSMEGKPRPAKIDGFTPEQRFFLGWAQVWAEKATPEFEKLMAQNNEHPAARFRVNGPLSNMSEFAEAYQCKPGSAMVRPAEQRCQIW